MCKLQCAPESPRGDLKSHVFGPHPGKCDSKVWGRSCHSGSDECSGGSDWTLSPVVMGETLGEEVLALRSINLLYSYGQVT